MNQRKNYDVTIVADERIQPTHAEISEAVQAAIDKKLHNMSPEDVPRSGKVQIDIV